MIERVTEGVKSLVRKTIEELKEGRSMHILLKP